MLFQVGCRTKWNYWSDKSTPFCTGQQYRWICGANFPHKMAVSEFWKNGMRASTILDMRTLERRLVASNHASTWNTLSPLYCTATSILHTTHSLFWWVVFHPGWQNLPGILWSSRIVFKGWRKWDTSRRGEIDLLSCISGGPFRAKRGPNNSWHIFDRWLNLEEHWVSFWDSPSWLCGTDSATYPRFSMLGKTTDISVKNLPKIKM